MRKVILMVNASLDGFMGGEGGDMSWMVDDEEMDDDFTIAVRDRADTILTGRALYETVTRPETVVRSRYVRSR